MKCWLNEKAISRPGSLQDQHCPCWDTTIQHNERKKRAAFVLIWLEAFTINHSVSEDRGYFRGLSRSQILSSSGRARRPCNQHDCSALLQLIVCLILNLWFHHCVRVLTFEIQWIFVERVGIFQMCVYWIINSWRRCPECRHALNIAADITASFRKWGGLVFLIKMKFR